MATHSRAVTTQATELARKLGYPSSWIGDQLAAQLVPDFHLPWPRQVDAWAVIRDVRTRSVAADVAAVEIALHGDRGFYTALLRGAVVRLAQLDSDVTEPTDGESDETAERAAVALMEGAAPGATPSAEMVRRVLAANSSRGPVNGATSPIVADDLHALATTMVGLEDVWKATHRRVGAMGSPEALRAVEAVLADDPAMADGPIHPTEWAAFVGELDGALGGAPFVQLYGALVEQAPPDALLAAVRMAGQFRPEWIGAEARGRKSRAQFVASVTPLNLFLRAAVIAGRQANRPERRSNP